MKLVFLCSPNNPTGNRLDAARRILELARALEGRALLVVDEAYVEFARRARRCSAQLAQHPWAGGAAHAVQGAWLSPARAAASLIAHAEVIALLRKVIQPYAVSQLTIEAVLRALEPGRAAAVTASAWR